MTNHNTKHYLKEFSPIRCPICGGEAYLYIKLYWGDRYILTVRCEFCSNKEYIDYIDYDICENCPNKCEEDNK